MDFWSILASKMSPKTLQKAIQKPFNFSLIFEENFGSGWGGARAEGIQVGGGDLRGFWALGGG